MMTSDEMIEVIQAYKNGKKIQVKAETGWITIACTPSWNFADNIYRVAPQPEEYYVFVRRRYSRVRLNETEPFEYHNLKLTFVEGKLVGAEVINK